MAFICDFLPYRRLTNAGEYRTLEATAPQDWTNVTAKSDDTGRFGVIAAATTAEWTPIGNQYVGEVLAYVMLRPGLYTTTAVKANNAKAEARIDTAAGTLILIFNGTTVSTVALPASVWTSSSAFNDCWLRLVQRPGTTAMTARVWSVTDPEPATWNASVVLGLSFNVPGPFTIGTTAAAGAQAFRFVGFGDGTGTDPVAPLAAADPGYFDKWFKDANSAGAQRLITADIYIPSYDGIQTTTFSYGVLRVANQFYRGGGAWPYNTTQVYLEGIEEWPEFERRLPESLFGRQDITVSDLKINNTDGRRDDWLRAKTNKAIVVLKIGDPSWSWFDLRTLFTGEVVDVFDEPGVLTFRLRDLASRYDRPVARSTLLAAGANTGKPTPIVVGSVTNISPVLVDAATLTYRVGEADINAITVVRDRGVSLSTLVLTIIAFDSADDSAIFSAPHSLVLNDAIVLAGRLPSPLSAGTYYVKAIPTTSRVRFSSTSGGALIDLTQGDAGNASTTIWPSTDTIRTSAAHGRSAGNIVRVVPTLGIALTGGLAENTDYYVIATGLTANELKLSLSNGGAAVDLIGNPITIYAAHSVNDTLETETDHNLSVNDVVRLAAPVPSNTSAGVDYYVKTVPTSRTLTLSTTVGGATLDVQGIPNFTTISAVNATTDEITLADGSLYAVGNQLDLEGAIPAPLVAGTAYWVQAKPSTHVIKVAAFPGGPAIDLTSTTSGGNSRRYQTGGTIERPVAPFTIISYAGTASLDQVIPDLANGKFRLRSNPAGQITADVQGQKMAGAYSARASHALKVLVGAGDPLISTSLGDGSLYDSWRTPVGVFVAETANLAELIDYLAQSCYSWWCCNRLGTLVSKAFLDGFNGTPTATITEAMMDPDDRLRMTAKRLPVDRYEGVRVGWGRNYTQQNDADLAGSVSQASRSLYKEQWSIVTTNAGGSGNLPGFDLGEKGERRRLPLIETALRSQADAELLRDISVINIPKQLGVFTVSAAWRALDAYQLGRHVLIKTSRYGIDINTGKAFLVIGIKERRDGYVALTLLTDLDAYVPYTP